MTRSWDIEPMLTRSIVAAEYLFALGDHTPTAWETKALAVGVITAVILCE